MWFETNLSVIEMRRNQCVWREGAGCGLIQNKAEMFLEIILSSNAHALATLVSDVVYTYL